MDDSRPPKRDRLPSIKQILAILAAGVFLLPGLCLAIGLADSQKVSTMITLAVLASVCTLVGVVLLLVRGIRDFLRH
jgi:hypothetical protein